MPPEESCVLENSVQQLARLEKFSTLRRTSRKAGHQFDNCRCIQTLSVTGRVIDNHISLLRRAEDTVGREHVEGLIGLFSFFRFA